MLSIDDYCKCSNHSYVAGLISTSTVSHSTYLFAFMASFPLPLHTLLFTLQLLYLLWSTSADVSMKPQTYIVHMNHHAKPLAYATHHDWYASHLQSLPASTLLYTYTTAFHGFAASLEPDQAENLRSSGSSVLGVFEESVYSLHTTRSPDFLGLSVEFGSSMRPPVDHKDVIVGVLDTGVWPESRSFDDEGMTEVPARWKGECESGPDFHTKLCNRKLIGARSFSKGYHVAMGGGNYFKDPKEPESARDQDGHGTHTASTVAGSPVKNASLLGYAIGTARGMAPRARLAAYKVCWKTGCFGSDILAAIERSILDGVDVLSLSLGGGSAPYYHDTIAIGSFAAMERGIFVSCSAGNSGPSRASLANVAPWIMTVGAGTLDRDFPAYVELSNLNRFTGVSLYSGPSMGREWVGLVYGKGENGSSNLCLPDSLEPELVRGKVVLCDRGVNPRVEKGAVVKSAGGVGMILANTATNGEELVADTHLLPALAVGSKTGHLIREYIRSKPDPMASLSFGGTVLNVRPSPAVAAFSSRGPNLVTPQILKPDIIGPGVNILAGWSEAVGPTGLEKDLRRSPFNIISGTSMSCPHISGLAALLKAAHPNWNPSMIKSALMTTAYTQDNTNSALRDASDGSYSTPWAHGSGHVDPQKALSPGLVYDITPNDYIAFLCSLDYKTEQIKVLPKRSNVTCSTKLSDPGELNYPSFSVMFVDNKVVKYTRELTNVGEPGSVYEVTVKSPLSVSVTVKPQKLVFPNIGDKMRYTVTFISKKDSSLVYKYDFGSIVWSSARHEVRSPVAFAWTKIG